MAQQTVSFSFEEGNEGRVRRGCTGAVPASVTSNRHGSLSTMVDELDRDSVPLDGSHGLVDLFVRSRNLWQIEMWGSEPPPNYLSGG